MKTYFRILSYARPLNRFVPAYAILAIFAVVFGLINFTLLIPLLNVLFDTAPVNIELVKPEFHFNILYFRDLFNYYFGKILLDHGRVGALQFVCVVLVFSVFAANVFKYTSQRVMSSMRTTTVYNIRRNLFDKITDLHLGYFNKHQKGQLISRLTNDVNEIENSVVSSVQVVFKEPLMIIGYLVLLFIMSVELTIFTLMVLPLSGFFISVILKKLKRESRQIQELLGTILSVIEETISGVRIIKAFNAQPFVRKQFKKQNIKHRTVLKSMWNKRELASPVSEFAGVLVVALVLLYGGTLVLENNSELSASEFITYIILYSQILVPAKSISTAISNIQRGIASGERIFEIMDTDISIKDHPRAKSFEKFNNKIEYKNVTFGYESEMVLKDISFTIPEGKITALVGSSGSGKSTIADLLPRFYDSKSGEILMDGIPVQEIKLKDLRKQLGIVTQESILFNDTVFNNIAFGVESASEDAVIKAAKIANAHEFIIAMPEGYQTNIGDRGSKLSGGQRQRMSIARAIFKNPPILILDEATSALDTESERLVQEALQNLMKNRTTLVIAHRLSTIQHANEILVIDKGEIVERGTHDHLLEKKGIYKKLYDLQSFI
ncbi:MAG: ATP-binding cassette domain-containing protein [Bacteroidetes bacterium]|nr:ATP-binding cassette domain-containing protein [Bacteroidota bacterium]HET6242971.1 ABC transporter transmembrane domain-containing protein [Bacteroidia bacterium]